MKHKHPWSKKARFYRLIHIMLGDFVEFLNRKKWLMPLWKPDSSPLRKVSAWLASKWVKDFQTHYNHPYFDQFLR